MGGIILSLMSFKWDRSVYFGRGSWSDRWRQWQIKLAKRV